MTHDYQVQNKNQKSEAKAEVKVDDDDDVTRAFVVQVRRLSLLFGKKTWNRTPKNIYTSTTSLCVNKAQWLLEITSFGAVSLFLFQAKITQLNG